MAKNSRKKYYNQLIKNYKKSEIPHKIDPNNASFDDVALFAMFRRSPRLMPSTVSSRITTAISMQNHKISVNFWEPTIENWLKHADYREEIEDATYDAMKNEWKTMRLFLDAYGIPNGKGTHWTYSPPQKKKHIERLLPSPEEIRRLIHFKYAKNKFLNTTIQHIILHNYCIGWRVPSEPNALKVGDVDYKNNIIILREQKKYGKPRPLRLSKSVIKSPRRKSLWNYEFRWRKKYVHNDFIDSFYLNALGEPFTRDSLRAKLYKYVVPAHLKIRRNMGLKNWDDPRYVFHPNQCRAWTATAVLIAEYLKSNRQHWNEDLVRRRLGHDIGTKTMDHYTRLAEIYVDIYPYDWLKYIRDPKSIKKRD